MVSARKACNDGIQRWKFKRVVCVGVCSSVSVYVVVVFPRALRVCMDVFVLCVCVHISAHGVCILMWFRACWMWVGVFVSMWIFFPALSVCVYVYVHVCRWFRACSVYGCVCVCGLCV